MALASDFSAANVFLNRSSQGNALKLVIVGGSKILIGIVIVITVLAAVVMLWLKFGISPFDRLNARVGGLSKTDPDQALALYAQILVEADKAHISVQYRSKVYLGLGRLLYSHRRYEQAIEALNKSLALSRSSGRGTTETSALLDIAQCQLRLQQSKKPTKADIESLLVAPTIHPPKAPGESDLGFWPAYEQLLGRLYATTGDYQNALGHLQKAVEYYKVEKSDGGIQESQGWIIDTLIRQGKYVEANEKFIEFVEANQKSSKIAGDVPVPDTGHHLRSCFRRSLKWAQDKDPEFYQRVGAMLSQKKFAELDKLAGKMQASKKILPSGRWYINDLYGALDSMEQSDFESTWLEHIRLLEQWVQARPDSATAKITLGDVLTSYAWKARGNGWADSVTEEGWKKYRERLNQARVVLDQVKDKPAEWYLATQRCALGQGWEADQYNAMVAEGQKLYPDYDLVVLLKSYWLQPRWHGKEGEYERYIAGEADKRQGAPGDKLYARSAWYLDDNGVDNVMNETKLSWPRVKSGLQQIIKQYPDSLLAKGMLSMLAMEVKDKQTAETAFGAATNGK
jgi:tetratricopeptide (TPR) repeat protein